MSCPIFVPEGGRAVEQGGYSDLVGRKGRFARMADLQEREVA